MHATGRLFVLLAAVALAAPALADPEPTPDDLQRNRQLLDKWRADPEHYLRLKHDLREFYRLPPEQRDRLRQLDHDLHATDSRTQKRLYAVMERYAAWLERLPEEQQRQIAAAPDRETRLALVREIRTEQWVQRQPAAVQGRLAQLDPGKRQAEVAALRRKERERRHDWEQIVRTPLGPPRPNPKPARLSEFPADVQQYVERVLRPQLNPAEREQLQKAGEEPWPALARTVRELADKHPVALPGPPRGPARFRGLPPAVQAKMPLDSLKPQQKQRIQRAAGKWPQFAEEFTAVARQQGVTLPAQLGPCRPTEFSPAVQAFLAKELGPKLSPEEAERLHKAEGQWPEYPRLLLQLATKRQLAVPGMALPGPKELWDRAKVARAEPPVPDVPDRTLRTFAQSELSGEERAALRLSADDPSSRERLRAKYFEKHPQQFQRQQRIDRQFLGVK